MTAYAKWSEHNDCLMIWDSETGEVLQRYSETEWMRHYGIKTGELKYAKAGYLRPTGEPTNDLNLDKDSLDELFKPRYRIAEATGRVERFYLNQADFNPETNPAFFVPGENEDATNGRWYGRPLPAGVSYTSLRPA